MVANLAQRWAEKWQKPTVAWQSCQLSMFSPHQVLAEIFPLEDFLQLKYIFKNLIK